MAAAISYYTVFAVPPLLALLTLLASEFVRPPELQELLSDQIAAWVGVESATQIVGVVQEVARPELGGPTAILGLLAVLFGATNAFVQLQNALNAAWGVAPDPERGDVRTFFVKRAVSLVMILATGVLLVVLLGVSTVLSAFHGGVRSHAPERLGRWVLTVMDAATSLAVVTGLLAVIFRYVPDAVIRWRDALVGALFTGVLFTGGKLIIGYYLGHNDLANVYGAAGSLAVALLWIYYTANILLLGAEFTEVWACRHGEPVRPQRGAVNVERRIRRD
jgi:membrane protein